MTDDLIARLRQAVENVDKGKTSSAWLFEEAADALAAASDVAQKEFRRGFGFGVAAEAAEALAAASRPQQEPRLTEQDTIDMVVTHWFTQGGEAQFGAIPTCHNADEVVSEILRAVRASAPPAAPPPWQLLKQVHGLLNKESIGRLNDGHHETSAEGWQWWMSERQRIVRLVETALSEAPLPSPYAPQEKP